MARITFQHGLNETESTKETEAYSGYNFDLELGARRLFPRRPIDLKGTAPNGGCINGIAQLIERDDTETTLIITGHCTTPTIYSWTGDNTSTAFTSKRTTNVDSSSMIRGTHWPLDDVLTLTDLRKVTPLLSWNGNNCARHKTGLTEGTPASVTLACSGGTVTATEAAHGRAVGDLVTIAGADEAAFNGEYEVQSVPTTTAFTYTITSCPTTTATGTITADSGIDLYAKYAVTHNGRLWLFNVKTGSDENEHMCLASEFEDRESFDTVNRSGIASGNAAFYTLTPDLKPINGVCVFNRQLIISTVDGALHRLSGTDASDYQFVTYYAGSAAIGEESIANIGNDVAYLRKGGNIDLLTATDSSGDVGVDDVSRWIPDTVKDATGSITLYDQHNQKVFFLQDNEAWVLFKDILYSGEGSPWSVYKTNLTSTDETGATVNLFDTNGALYMRRPSTTQYTIYIGDQDGNIYDLNGLGTGDNGDDIAVSRETPLIETDRKQIMRGNVQYRRLGAFNASLIFDWANEYNETQSDINFKGPPAGETPTYYGGAFYYSGTENFYSEGFAFADKVSRQNFAPAGRSEAFFMTFYTETTVRFHIDHIAILE